MGALQAAADGGQQANSSDSTPYWCRPSMWRDTRHRPRRLASREHPLDGCYRFVYD